MQISFDMGPRGSDHEDTSSAINLKFTMQGGMKNTDVKIELGSTGKFALFQRQSSDIFSISTSVQHTVLRPEGS